MKAEIEFASRWWSDKLSQKMQNRADVIEQFRAALVVQLEKRFTGHWHEEDRLRGSAYRSVSFDQRIDGALVDAGLAVGLDARTLEQHLEHARFQIMFINPREVKILNSALLSDRPKTVFRVGGQGKRGKPKSTVSTASTSSDRSTSPSSPPSSPDSSPSSSPSSSPRMTASPSPTSPLLDPLASPAHAVVPLQPASSPTPASAAVSNSRTPSLASAPGSARSSPVKPAPPGRPASALAIGSVPAGAGARRPVAGPVGAPAANFHGGRAYRHWAPHGGHHRPVIHQPAHQQHRGGGPGAFSHHWSAAAPVPLFKGPPVNAARS